jgi:integrase
MIRRGVNPEIARRQLRHKNIETTMKIYVQINNQELEDSLPTLPFNRLIKDNNDGKVIDFTKYLA